MNLDLFGDKLEQKGLTSMQRMASRQASIPGRDLYTTEPKDIERFLVAIERDRLKLLSPIWEPAAGRGDISKMLIRYGYSVYSTDIIPYSDNEIEIKATDFFTSRNPKEIKPHKTIFTNPPFNMQEEFLKHALSFCLDVIFFVRLSFLTSIRRYKIYKLYNPAYVYVYTARAHCYKDGDVTHGQNMIDYCVMWWKPPYRGETIIRWIA
jgi:hypothetical protein